MPLTYVRDDRGRRINITLTTPVTVADLVASVERQFAEGAWGYGVLADARLMSRALEVPEIRTLVSRVQTLVTAHGPRGPVAFVARQSQVIGAAQIYRMFGGDRGALEVFWDPRDAQQWLDARLGPQGGSPTSD
jgi:hypothetical protein